MEAGAKGKSQEDAVVKNESGSLGEHAKIDLHDARSEKSPTKIIRSLEASATNIDNKSLENGSPVVRKPGHPRNFDSDEPVLHEAIQIELDLSRPKKASIHNSRVSLKSDSLNEEDEVEDEDRSPVQIQINYSSNVTRAGVQRNNFGPARKLSPTLPKAGQEI